MRVHTLLLSVFLLAGCGGIESELLEALQAKEQSPLCVGPSILGVDAVEANDGKQYVGKAGAFSFMNFGGGVNALEKLKSEGYVSREATMMPMGFGTPVEAFEITKKGEEYFLRDEFSGILEVCLGEKKAVEILEYTEPSGGGPQVVQARFSYKLKLNDLADDLGLEDEIEAALAQSWPGEGMGTFTKTNKGWRLEMAFWQ
jgi:hypothetical protein